MATGALVIGWGPAVRGREQKALQVFNEAIQYYTQLQQQAGRDRELRARRPGAAWWRSPGLPARPRRPQEAERAAHQRGVYPPQ